jgi:hypothetical protein
MTEQPLSPSPYPLPQGERENKSLPAGRQACFQQSILLGIVREERRGKGQKGDGSLLCKAPEGPFRQKTPVPFLVPKRRVGP